MSQTAIIAVLGLGMVSCCASSMTFIMMPSEEGPTGPGPTGPGSTGPGPTGPGSTGPGPTGPGPTGPTCTIQRGDIVYQCSDYVYQSQTNAQQQCGQFGSTINPTPFIWDDTTGSACGINRGDTVYSGCGYIYQKQSDRTRQCSGTGGQTYSFIPTE